MRGVTFLPKLGRGNEDMAVSGAIDTTSAPGSRRVRPCTAAHRRAALFYPGDLRPGLRGGGAAPPATSSTMSRRFSRSGDGVERSAPDGLIVVIGNNEYGHLDHLGFVAEFFDQRLGVGHFDAALRLAALPP